MRYQRLAHLRAPQHEIEHAGRQLRLLAGGHQPLGHRRGQLGGLQDHRAAGQQRRRQLGRDLMQRVIPRRNGGHHPDRCQRHAGIADRADKGERIGQRRRGAPRGDWRIHLDAARQLQRHADFARDLSGQFRRTAFQRVGQREQVWRPPGCVQRLPAWLRPRGSRHGCGHIFRTAEAHLAQRRFGRRIMDAH
ncbi:hypothetical protein D3C81_945890 [compost metagenome]